MQQIAELDRELSDARASMREAIPRLIDRCRQIEGDAGPADEAVIGLAIHCLMRKHDLLPSAGRSRRRSGRVRSTAAAARALPPGATEVRDVRTFAGLAHPIG
ncbi:hypothetical protein [Agrilutibacter solisilvae]|uniref:Uncharacterized protein n=1 Tax=Agrilutibacter solisilvae TaxID=2763317 RepID=A0A974XZC9_9GAMM|nr:hypothetical protein [Lysobacter solisilvae]QSX78572.1 hypothetical protein I8J32_001085 [Lysobacter solisilvae]